MPYARKLTHNALWKESLYAVTVVAEISLLNDNVHRAFGKNLRHKKAIEFVCRGWFIL